MFFVWVCMFVEDQAPRMLEEITALEAMSHPVDSCYPHSCLCLAISSFRVPSQLGLSVSLHGVHSSVILGGGERAEAGLDRGR